MLLFAALSAAFPGTAPAEQQPAASSGGELVIGDSHPVTQINPVRVTSGLGVTAANLIFSRLVRYEPDGSIGPELAKSWTVSEDGKTYTFHLRRGVLFHDGSEFTAADADFTYRLIGDKQKRSPYYSLLSKVAEYRVVDPYTFQILLNEPDTSFIHECVREILSRKHGAAPEGDASWKPVGTGPFRFASQNGDTVVLEASETYFAGRPHLDRVLLKAYPSRAEVWSAFMRGEIGMLWFMSVEDYELTRKDPAFRSYAVPTSDYYTISYNLKDALMADVRVRRALGHAIDRKTLIKEVEKGYGIESTGPFRPGYRAFNEKVAPLAYEPEESLRLLSEAGWKDSDGDGTLDKAGNPLVFRMMVNAKDGKLHEIALHVRQNLDEIGVQTQLMPYDTSIQMSEWIESGAAHAHLTFFLGNEPDPGEIAKLWHSADRRKGKFSPEPATNAGIDQLIELGRSAAGENERLVHYRELHKRVYEEQLACFLYFPYMFHAISSKYGGTDAYFESLQMPDYLVRDFYVNAKGGDR